MQYSTRQQQDQVSVVVPTLTAGARQLSLGGRGRGMPLPLAQRAFPSVDAFSHRTERVVTTTVARSAPAPRPRAQARRKLVFGWIQDVSGSMSGRRLEASLAGLDYMHNHIFRPSDFLGVMTYNGDLNTLHLPMPISKVDSERDADGIRKGLAGNYGYDRCYDAIGHTIMGLRKMAHDPKYNAITKDAVYEMLLLTDGGDNYSSEFTLRQAAELVAKPGIPDFHFVVVAVSMSTADKAKLRQLCEPVHATLIEIANISELHQTLQKIGETVQERLVYTTTTTSTVVEQVVRSHGGFGHSRGDSGDRRVIDAPTARSGPRGGEAVPKPPKICKNFASGACRFGSSCHFLHVA
jgi:uncharacterized protein YegL